ncbi:MAG: enoyl-CoA hydratase/isomerase family protein [Candidatus Thorarchaeota archaeon]
MSGKIIVERNESRATVTFSKPEKLNSVTWDMLKSFSEQTTELLEDPEIRAIIFTGEGEHAFSAGFDLDTVIGLSGRERIEFFTDLENIMKAMRHADSCIMLSACNGYAIGFGAMVAVASDLRFFSENAVFRLPEVDLDIYPGAGASSNLLHIVGPSRALDILLTTRKVSAEEAYRLGLADRLLPLDKLLSYSYEYIDELMQKDPGIVVATKATITKMVGLDIKDAAKIEFAFFEKWLKELEE